MKMPPSDAGNYAEQTADILAVAVRLIEDQRRFALVTSLAIEGGAAREVGALAVVDQDGQMTGYLSNGCIDRDIQHRACAALAQNRKDLIRYGEGSRFVDLKLPCGGALEVLIDPDPDRAALIRAKQDFDARRPATLVFWPGAVGTGLQEGHRFTYAPPVRLCLAGRGAVFRAMAQLGSAAGYDLHLMSPDPLDLAAVGHLAAAPVVHLTSPSQKIEPGFGDSRSAFLTLFHDHDWEPHLLRQALETPAGFIGSLGSRRTHARRCDTLRAMGVSDRSMTRLHGPIGLVGSLRDASLIAVSALAEIVATFPSQLIELRRPTPADPPQTLPAPARSGFL